MGTRAINLALMLALTLAACPAWANNLGLTNVTVKPLDDTRAFVQFDIRWENSWRHTNINHDAVWLFFKIKPDGRSCWEHVTLETNGHVAGTGTAIQIIVPSDRVGCILRRAAEGSGTLSVTNVKVAWNFASNSLVRTDRVRLQAFAVEMVYVAEGEFDVGSGGTESGSFTDGAWTTNATIPFRITNEAALAITNAAGSLWGTLNNANTAIGAPGILSANFPKGYAAFYCMKYEITQGQYRDFLNTLTRVQQTTRAGSQVADYFSMSATAAISYRNGIRCPFNLPLAPGTIVFGCDGNTNKIFNETNDAMDRACNWVSWADGCAFADWAGLRPMTELEFEKACRGPLDPVADEYAWGDITISPTTALLNDGTGMERATNGNCNYNPCTPDGPFRAGIYAMTNSTRQMAGASYWGIMELSGNVWERVVTVGDSGGIGRLFTGLHGDGQLPANGYANVINWPGADAAGAGYRGGGTGYFDDASRACVSYRVHHNENPDSARYYNYGGRAIRTAPAGVGP